MINSLYIGIFLIIGKDILLLYILNINTVNILRFFPLYSDNLLSINNDREVPVSETLTKANITGVK